MASGINKPQIFSDLKTLTQKAEKYCAIQERCGYEVNLKLIKWGVEESKRKILLEKLTNAGFINEERFAIIFAESKFRHNKWGKIKISYELKIRKIAEDNIVKALNNIPEDEYLSLLKKVAQKKQKEIKAEDLWEKKQKLLNYLLSKGFEHDKIAIVIKNL